MTQDEYIECMRDATRREARHAAKVMMWVSARDAWGRVRTQALMAAENSLADSMGRLDEAVILANKLEAAAVETETTQPADEITEATGDGRC